MAGFLSFLAVAYLVAIVMFKRDLGIHEFHLGHAVVPAILGAWASSLTARRRSERERARSRTATDLRKAASSGALPTRPIALYLRGFRLDGAASSKNVDGSDWILSPKHFRGPAKLPFEVAIAEALDPHFDLVALGDRPLPGPGQIRVADAGWEQHFQWVARQAALVLTVPAPSEGVRKEVAFLRREGLLSKTLLLVPPKGAFELDAWRQTVESLSEHLRLPRSVSPGTLLAFTDEGEVRASLPLRLKSRALARQIAQLLPQTVLRRKLPPLEVRASAPQGVGAYVWTLRVLAVAWIFLILLFSLASRD
jgi:hypothetical protein